MEMVSSSPKLETWVPARLLMEALRISRANDALCRISFLQPGAPGPHTHACSKSQQVQSCFLRRVLALPWRAFSELPSGQGQRPLPRPHPDAGAPTYRPGASHLHNFHHLRPHPSLRTPLALHRPVQTPSRAPSSSPLYVK